MGLRVSDLDGCLYDYISIDEYQPKVSDNNVVCCFYTKTIESAKDLCDFHMKSGLDILDIEYGGADEDQKYTVLIEVERNKDMYDTIMGIIKDTNSVSNIYKWGFSSYKKEKVIPLNKENLIKRIPLK
jgi:hypothetical protein